MRTAALALVMICGAAVVLWYADMLNSWVLGGLVGGLAALLLSVPISLALFSYLSHRHDEQLQAEAQEEVSLAQVAYYNDFPFEVHESPAYNFQQREDEWREHEGHAYISTARNLPVPSSSRLPVKRQSQHLPVDTRQPMAHSMLVREAQPDDVSVYRKGQQNQRGATLRQAPAQTNFPGAYGYQTRTLRATQQTAALRAARLEAEQQMEMTNSSSYSTSKRLPAMRQVEHTQNSQPISRQLRSPVSGQSLARPPVNSQVVSSNTAYKRETRVNSRPLLEAGRYPAKNEPQTDQLPTRNSIRSREELRQLPSQTGQIERRARVEGHPRNPEIVTGSLKNPMTRRAPYMYEDDPLRKELAQQLDPPSVRRSSLFDRYQEDED